MPNEVEPMEAPTNLPVVSEGGAITPMQMLQIAVEQNADLDKLTKLMDLQERWEANEARKAFVTALSAFKANPPMIVKDKQVSFPSQGGTTEYKHATLDQVCDVVGKALSEHGLSHTWKIAQGEGGSVQVTCVLTHALGHAEETAMSAPPDASGKKNAIQQIASTVTYLERYTLLAATGLATTGMDDDGDSWGVAPISAEQKDELIALIMETGADTAKLCQFFGVQSVDQIHAAKFDRAKQMLESKRVAK